MGAGSLWPTKRNSRQDPPNKTLESWNCHDSLYQIHKRDFYFGIQNKCNFTGRSWRDPIDEYSLLGRIPGDLTCMLANASLSIPLPNKGTFIEIGGLVNSRFLGGTGLPLQYLLHCSQSTLHLSRLSTQVCKQLKFLAASSLTFHSYPLVSWPPNKG